MKTVLSNYLLLVFVVGYLGAVKFRCDYSYSNVGWFKFHKIPATWTDAVLRCRHEGAELASPTSADIRAAMLQPIEDVDIFTGIYATSPGTYRAIQGIPLNDVSYKWAANEPDNKGNAERCITIDSEGNFSDVKCDIPRPYMCHKSYSVKTPNECGTTDSEYRFDRRTNKCYKFHTTPRIFERADLVCDAEGGHLAIINSDIESKVIYDIFTRNKDKKVIGAPRADVAFIGFMNWNSQWTTIHGQSLKQAGFDKFFPGEPNNGTEEYCGSVFRNGFLNDLSCNIPYAFICEKKADYPAVCDSDHLDTSTIKTYSIDMRYGK